MNLIIAGYGFVGKAHEAILKNYHNLTIVDPKYNDNNIKDIDADAIIVCVSTPSCEDGSCDITHILEVIEATHINIPILIKSTISIEGWNKIKETFPRHRITFSPEYLRAANHINDMLHVKQIELGGDSTKFWKDIFKVIFPSAKIIINDPKVLIINKYARNSFLATKVSWFNQLYDLCEAYDVDYQEVADVVSSDHRIGVSHTDVTQARGWGGHCFPKDTQALIHSAESLGVSLSLLKEAVEYNNKIRS